MTDDHDDKEAAAGSDHRNRQRKYSGFQLIVHIAVKCELGVGGVVSIDPVVPDRTPILWPCNHVGLGE